MKKRPIIVPPAGESITEATLSSWLKKDGDYVELNENILVLETDKASMDLTAEVSGSLEILVKQDETVKIGQTLGYIDPSKEKKPEDKKEEKKEEKKEVKKETEDKKEESLFPTQSSLSEKKNTPIKTSPSVRKIARDKDIDLSKVKATGQKGQIKKQDLFNPLKDFSSESSFKEASSAEPSFKRKKMSRLRQTISKRLLESQNQTASLTTFNEIDMTEVIQLRTEFKETFLKRHGVKLGFMGFFVKACIEALKDFPHVNSFIENDEIVSFEDYNIGIAVGTEKGLFVPVIKQAQNKSIADIEKSIRFYADKAKSGKIEITDLEKGSFTITNGGVYGSLMSTPILNPPQSGILGLHKIEKRPVVLNEEVRIRSMMYVALTYDHRLIDGSESVRFLVKVKECIENPSKLLLEI